MVDTTVYPLTPHGKLRGPDTKVYVIDAAHGLIGGLAIVWNRPVYGSSGGHPQTWKCIKAKGYSYKSLKDTPLLWNHDPDQDIGEVFTKSFVEMERGIFAFATLRDPELLIKAAIGLLYYSPQLFPYGSESSVVKGGLMTELTITDNPGTVLSPRSMAENRAVYNKLDAIRAAIMNYAGVTSPDATLDDLPDDVISSAVSQIVAHAPEDEATGVHEGQPIDIPDSLSITDAIGQLSPYERLVGPTDGRSRTDLRRAGIGA